MIRIELEFTTLGLASAALAALAAAGAGGVAISSTGLAAPDLSPLQALAESHGAGAPAPAEAPAPATAGKPGRRAAKKDAAPASEQTTEAAGGQTGAEQDAGGKPDPASATAETPAAASTAPVEAPKVRTKEENEAYLKDEVRPALAKVMAAKGQAGAVAIMQSFGFPNLSSVPTERYDDLVAACNVALGEEADKADAARAAKAA